MNEYLQGLADEYERSGGEISNILSVLVEAVEQKWSPEQLKNWLVRDFNDWPVVQKLIPKKPKVKRKRKNKKR